MIDEGPEAALARYYDLDLIDDPGDLPLYEALARRTGGPVLELAVGSGRLAVPLAERGFDVTGVDIDRHMLDRAQRAWADIAADAEVVVGRGSLELIESDVTELDLGRRFGLVLLALNTLLLLGSRARQVAALGTMARHLRPDGLAVVDVWLPGVDDLALYDGRVILEWQRLDPERDAYVAKLASAGHDPATGTVTLHQSFDAWPTAGGPVRRVSRIDRMRLVSADELVAMAEQAGLEVEQLAGDHDMTPFGPGAERAILVAHGR